MNGTARPEDDTLCTNCGQYGHRKYECKQPAPMANRLTCHVCGGVGHVGMDCVYKDDPAMLQASAKRAEQMDEQYATFLAEIGGSKGQQGGQTQSVDLCLRPATTLSATTAVHAQSARNGSPSLHLCIPGSATTTIRALSATATTPSHSHSTHQAQQHTMGIRSAGR